MNDNEFFITIWKIVAACFCCMVITLGSCTANTHWAISHDLSKGIDPVGVQCAHGNSGVTDTCTLLTVKK